MANFFSSLFGRKRSEPQIVEFPAPKYEGRSPFSSPIPESDFQDLGKAYLGQIRERSQGKGLVGFDPERRNILRNEFNEDFGDYSKDVLNRTSGVASAQGFRGGLPVEARNDAERSLARARQSALAGIDVEDLAARREDINKATYAQPDFLGQTAGIQQNAAAFDLAKNQFEQPDRRVFAGTDQKSIFEQVADPLSTAYLASQIGGLDGADDESGAQDARYATQYYGDSGGISPSSLAEAAQSALAPKSSFQGPNSDFARAVRERGANTGTSSGGSLRDAGFTAGSTAATAAGHPEIAIALQLANAFMKSRKK